MPWFREKTTPVELIQWNGVMFDCDVVPAWLEAAVDNGMVERGRTALLVKTMDDTIACAPTDWIGHGGGGLFVWTDQEVSECYDRVA